MMTKNNKWLLAALGVMLVAIIVSVMYIVHQKKEMTGLTQQFDIQKEELTDEYSQLAVQYEGYSKINIHNDSLLQLWENEKLKVQRLLEELRTVKATNASRIIELRKELATVREVMRSYIIQIDSLNARNKVLTEENIEVKKRYSEATETVSQLAKEKSELTDKVTLASQLTASDINPLGLDKRGKPSNKVSKIAQISISFKVAKNITASTGDKIAYIRIMKPDNDILTKNRMDLFKYENKDINYSCRRSFEYGGEEANIILYWNVEEYLYPGDYRVDIFVDGNMIGSKAFRFEK
jgi:cell division protein FtsL